MKIKVGTKSNIYNANGLWLNVKEAYNTTICVNICPDGYDENGIAKSDRVISSDFTLQEVSAIKYCK